MAYLHRVQNQPTPQSEPLPGRPEMVENSAGGYVFPVDNFTRLKRFLVLGSQGGSYYASERKLTLENADAVLRCAQEDPERTLEEILRASNGAAPKNDESLFALAIMASKGDERTRKLAFSNLPSIARTGSHLLQFAQYVTGMRGWGRGLRNAVRDWYESKGGVEGALYQVVKYRSRYDWTHRDLLRQAHPARNMTLAPVYDWVCHGTLAEEYRDDPRFALVRAYEAVQEATPREAADLVRDHKLTREMVPPALMTEKPVLEALFEHMPLTASVRSLGPMSARGVLTPMSEAAGRIIRLLNDAEALRRARIHPISVLTALLTYKAGKGVRGNMAWDPVQPVVDALDRAFEKSFEFAPQTGKRFYLGIDVSGSMGGGMVAGVPGLTPRMGAAAMAMAIMRREPNYCVRAFSSASDAGRLARRSGAKMMPLYINASQSLPEVVRATDKLPFGRTDCALPMLDALENRIPVDCFLVLTDSETWAGGVHPVKALQEYREKMGIPAKLVVVGMVSNGFSIADPEDAGMMDVVGFDAAVPRVLADFVSPAETDTALPTEEEEEV